GAVAGGDPAGSYGYGMLGWLAYRDRRMEEAAEFYRQAHEIEPFDAKNSYHWGQVLLALNRLSEAGECFRRVLTIDPNHAGGCQGLGHVLRQQGQAAEAGRYARRAARLTHYQNPDGLLTPADAHADAGRPGDARDTAAQALEAAQKDNPQLVPQIRQRLREFRERAAAVPK